MPKNIPVTLSNVKTGLKVIKGRDWKYGNQDNHSKYGIILSDEDVVYGATWYMVEWENGGSTNQYRVGKDINDICDLYVYEPQVVKSEFESHVKKFFRLNRLDEITLEIMEKNNLHDWVNKE